MIGQTDRQKDEQRYYNQMFEVATIIFDTLLLLLNKTTGDILVPVLSHTHLYGLSTMVFSLPMIFLHNSKFEWIKEKWIARYHNTF